MGGGVEVMVENVTSKINDERTFFVLDDKPSEGGKARGGV